MTTFSLLDGLSQPHQIASRCKQEGLLGSAITDHGNVAGAIAFSKAMMKEGLKPIIGVEFYVCHEDPSLKSNRKLTHLVILAKNMLGWRQLIKLTSESNKPENFYYKPRLDLATLAGFCDGNLIGISGHIGSCISDVVFSDIHQAASSGTKEIANTCVSLTCLEDVDSKAKELESIFGKGNFFLEIQLIDHKRMPASSVLADILRGCGERTNIPCVATPDAHYANKEDAIDQRVLLCTSLNITMQDVRRKLVSGEDVALGGFFKSNNYHIPSHQEMVDCGHSKDELDNTLLITDMCEEYKLTAPPTLPIFNNPRDLSSAQHLRNQCRKGWAKRKEAIDKVVNSTSHTLNEYVKRVKSELEILESVKFENGSCLSDYFLIVQDIIQWALDDGQLVGPGRGCLTFNTKIIMGDRTRKNIEDIEIGDMVVTHTGEARRVLNKFQYDVKKEDRLLKISTMSNSMTLTSDHKVLVERYCKDKLIPKWKWIRADELKPYDHIYHSPIGDTIRQHVFNAANFFIIQKIEEDKKFYKYVYDIAVEGTHNYLTSCGIVHNSAAGSLVLYLLGVTQIDPIQHDLLFGRFYNSSRNIPTYISYEEHSFFDYISK